MDGRLSVRGRPSRKFPHPSGDILLFSYRGAVGAGRQLTYPHRAASRERAIE